MKPLIGSGLQTDLNPKVVVDTSNGDHDKFAHYAPKDEVTYALVYGVPIIALCGKIWIPSRAPEGFSVCPQCAEIYESMDKEDPDDYIQ